MELNDDSFQIFAAKAYNRPIIIQSEFVEDLSRIQYIKRLLTKYYMTDVLKDRLILNHLTIFYNVFGIESANMMMFLRLDERDLEVIKPFLIYLNFLPASVTVNGKTINTEDIKLNKDAVECLRKL